MSNLDSYSHCIEETLRSYGKLAICLSGGADSCILLALAAKTLGVENVLALTVKTPYLPQNEEGAGAKTCQLLGVRHEVLTPSLPEEILSNGIQRCYRCKCFMFNTMKQHAKALGFELLADATHADDNAEQRPAMRARDEYGVVSPWQICGLKKEAIRQIGEDLGLPASIYLASGSSCMLTRFAFNTPATEESLRTICQIESFYRAIGFPECRVRITALNTIHIEVPEGDIARLAKLSPNIPIKVREKYGNADY